MSKPTIQKLLGKTSLRTVLVVPFVLQIILIVGLIGYLSFRMGRETVDDLVNQLMYEVGIRIEQYLDNYLRYPHLINKINSDAIRLEIINTEDMPKTGSYFWKQLHQFDTVSFISLGNEKGEFIGSEKLDNGVYTIEIKNEKTAPDKHAYAADGRGYPTNKKVGFRKNYDPRARGWYKTGKKAGKPVWSSIYQFSTSTAVRLGITAALPFTDNRGQFQGVLAADLVLTQIDEYLSQLKVGNNGQIFILEKNGLLVASSTIKRPFVIRNNKAERIKATDCEDILVRATTDHLLATFRDLGSIRKKEQTSFNQKGNRQFVQILPYNDGCGIDWLIVTVVPEDDFMGQIKANTHTTIFLCLGALFLAILIGIYTVRWVTQPIEALNTAAKHLAEGEWDKPVPTDRKDEVGELARSFQIMARQLQESFSDLEKRVAERTAELEDAKERAEVANRTKSAFLANMSHELRSPLNSILGFAQLLIRSHTLSPEQQENATVINRSGEHLLNLINQILDLSKIEAGRAALNETEVDFYRLLDDIEDMFRLKADEKGLELLFERQAEVPEYIQADQVKLRQILINLLNNALKFTREGKVSVQINCNEPTSEGDSKQRTLHFEIEDTGCGIKPEEMDKIFQAFGQTDDGTNAQEGTGLGLTISRKFIQMMGGEINVKSEYGHGTVFSFDIQVTEIEAQGRKISDETAQVVALAPGQPVYRLLVVDDKIENRQLIRKLLQPLGFDVKEAGDGQEAITICEQWHPHLIFMDIRMPCMNGYDATKQIKSSPAGKSAIVIALTASALEENRAEAITAGCDDFLRKPFREEKIFAIIKKYLGVQFIYEDSISETPEKHEIKGHEETISFLRELPEEWENQLHKALVEADPELIDQVMEKIQQHNPGLGDTLNQYLQNFQYDTIINLIKKSKL